MTQAAKPTISRAAKLKIGALRFDDKNANRGTERGRKALAASLKRYGAGRSILLDKKGRVIAGNKTLEQAKAAGHKDVIVVETDGSQLVAVKRTDLDLRDKKARALAVADNRVGELDLEWETDVIAELKKSADLSPFFSEKEFNKMIGATLGIVGATFIVLDRTWHFMEATVDLKLLSIDLTKFHQYLITANAEPVYTSASSAHKALYMYQCNNSDQYSNGDPGNTLA